MSKIIRTIFFSLLLTIAVNIQAYQKDKVYKLRVLSFNDSHGRFFSDRDGQGGFPAMATLVNSLRYEGMQDGYSVILLFAGDANTGVPESDLVDAEPDFAALNYMKVDAMTLGNHEFDKPRSVLDKQIKSAKFPVLSANIFDKKTKKPVFKQSISMLPGGLKVAIFGLTTEDTPLLTLPSNHKNQYFVPVVKEAQTIAPILKKNADFVIALTHAGYYEDGNNGTNAPGDVTIARNTKDINLIVGGHTHTPLEEYKMENGVIIIQAGSYTRYLAKLDLEFVNGKTTVVDYKLIPINLVKKVKVADKEENVLIGDQKIAEDPELLKIVNDYKSRGEKLTQVKIGDTVGIFNGEREIVRSQETNLGQLVAKSMALAVKADIGVMNSGGIRDSLPEGSITYRDILQVQPFGNTIVSFVLTGKELKDYLKVAASKTPGAGGFPQFYGVKLVLENGEITSLTVNDMQVDDSANYKIATNNFVAIGGDGYTPINKLPSFVDSGLVDAGVLRNYLEANKVLNAADYEPVDVLVVK